MRMIITVLVIGVPTTALGNQVEADTCASALAGPGKAIYDAAAPRVANGDDLETALRTTAREMVAAGQLSRSEARAYAMPAAQCLSKLSS